MARKSKATRATAIFKQTFHPILQGELPADRVSETSVPYLALPSEQPGPSAVWALLQEVARKDEEPPEDVPHFQERMKLFRGIMPKIHDKTISGALAFISEVANDDKMAENQGLFSIKAVGKGAKITNKADFKPRAF